MFRLRSEDLLCGMNEGYKQVRERKKRYVQVSGGTGPGDDEFTGGGFHPGRAGGGLLREGVSAALSEARVGGARPEGHPGEPDCLPEGGGAPGGHRPGGHRGHRHHEPAGDHLPVGPEDRGMRRERHCMAVPADLRDRRGPGARRPRGHDPRKDRAGAGRLFLRDEAEMDAGLLQLAGEGRGG